MRRLATRRELAAGAVATLGAAAGAALAGPGGAGPAPAGAAVLPPQTEPEVLTKALLIERLMVLAYRRVLGSGRLTPGVAKTVGGMLTDEIEHVSAIAARAAEIGLVAPTSPLDVDTAEALLAKYHVMGNLRNLPRTEGDCLVLLVDLESVAEGAYFNGLRDLHTAGLIRLSAEIMSCEAQHWTVLMELLNPGMIVKAVPWPFVLGTS
jgi:Ferritin-like domain